MDTCVAEYNSSFTLSNPKSNNNSNNQFHNAPLWNGSTASYAVDVISSLNPEGSSMLLDQAIENQPDDLQKTSFTDRLIDVLPKPLPFITGRGALEFRKELKTHKYPDEIKEFYKGSRELVKKLKIFD